MDDHDPTVQLVDVDSFDGEGGLGSAVAVEEQRRHVAVVTAVELSLLLQVSIGRHEPLGRLGCRIGLAAVAVGRVIVGVDMEAVEGVDRSCGSGHVKRHLDLDGVVLLTEVSGADVGAIGESQRGSGVRDGVVGGRHCGGRDDASGDCGEAGE